VIQFFNSMKEVPMRNWDRLVDEYLEGYSISRAVQALARLAEVGSLTLHQFRHSCASELLESGVKLPQVQQMLWHHRQGRKDGDSSAQQRARLGDVQLLGQRNGQAQ
jgi:integrase